MLSSDIKVVGHTDPYMWPIFRLQHRKRDEARKLFLECEKIYSKVYGPDHTETLDAARRAEEEDDKDESGEEDEE